MVCLHPFTDMYVQVRLWSWLSCLREQCNTATSDLKRQNYARECLLPGLVKSLLTKLLRSWRIPCRIRTVPVGSYKFLENDIVAYGRIQSRQGRSEYFTAWDTDKGLPEHILLAKHWSFIAWDTDKGLPEHIQLAKHWSFTAGDTDKGLPEHILLAKHWSFTAWDTDKGLPEHILLAKYWSFVAWDTDKGLPEHILSTEVCLFFRFIWS